MVVLRRVRIGRCTRLAVTLVISLFSGAASQYEVLDSVKDAKRFDANNVTVIGLFGSKSADGYSTFAKVLPTFGEEIPFAYSSDAKVMEHYGVKAPPAVVLFRNFNLDGTFLEMGGRTRVVYDGPFDDSRKLTEFVVGESLPAVLTVHDPSAWFNSAMAFRVPILILAHLRGAGTHDVPHILRQVHKSFKGKVACMDIEISDHDDNEDVVVHGPNKPIAPTKVKAKKTKDSDEMVEAVLRVAGLSEDHILFKPRAVLLHIPNRYYWPPENEVDAGSMINFINQREQYSSVMSKNFDKVMAEKKAELKAQKGKRQAKGKKSEL